MTPPNRRAGKRARLPALFLLTTLMGLPACDETPKPGASPRLTDDADRRIEIFLERHWARPLAPQGEPPASVKAHDISLSPQSCARCHAAQYEGWSKSLHSRAMGPGIMGQLANMPAHARDEHQECLRCHAPLNEQADSLSEAIARGFRGKPVTRPPLNVARPLHESGLACAACHVRVYEWYGPPRRDGSSPTGDVAQFPHAAWKVSPAFGDSRFCAACHQFRKDEYALNGKLLENTYEEWKASRFAREGKSCQSCHMPDRRHLWRGIHDPDMVATGVKIQATAPSVSVGSVAALLVIRNTGTGHYFPTYVTPRVVAEGYQEDAEGRMLEDTLKVHVIARQVPPDLSEEIADSRIPPDGEARLDYRVPLNQKAAALVFRVRVEPDAFYTWFYETLLRDGSACKGEAQIRLALDESRKTPFILYFTRQVLSARQP